MKPDEGKELAAVIEDLKQRSDKTAQDADLAVEQAKVEARKLHAASEQMRNRAASLQAMLDREQAAQQQNEAPAPAGNGTKDFAN